MDKQVVSFAVETENGIVKRIGRSVIAVPEVRFRGGEVKWLEDRYKGAKVERRAKHPDLNIRKGSGTNAAKTGKVTGKGIFTITEVRQGRGSEKGWGRLKSGAGWVALDFCEKV